MPKPQVSNEDLDELLDDDIDDSLDVADEEDEPRTKVRVTEPNDEDEDEEDLRNSAPPPRKPLPVAKPVPPVGGVSIVATQTGRLRSDQPNISNTPKAGTHQPDDVSDREFDKEAKKRRDQQRVNEFLERKRTEETTSVDEITELMLFGDTDKIMHELVQYCADNTGIKKAKQLLREARDRAKARVTRISGVVSVMLDELKEEEEDNG